MLNRNNKLTISRGLRGVTMLENLVALLILSIGLLGLAGLQACALSLCNKPAIWPIEFVPIRKAL